MQTATGNLINDRAWGAETVPGLEARRWTGYIDVKSTDQPGRWYAVSLPNTGRRDELSEPDRVMVLPTDFKINHFAIQPYDVKFAGTSAQLSLRNPGFLDNEKTIQFVNQAPYLNELFLRTTVGPSLLPSPPYLSHQVWVKLINAPKTDERLVISVGAIRKAEVFDWFRPEREETGALIWGERRNGTIGIIPGSEGAGDDGIRPGGRDFPAEDFFSVSPGTADLTPGQTITFYASGPATWTLVGGGTLSSTTGNTVIYTAPVSIGSATVTAVSTEDPTSSVQVPITIAVPTVSTVDLISDQTSLLVGGSANLIATVSGTGAFNPNVTFTFTGPITLSGSGNSRTLVATGPGTITVTATSVGDPSKSKTITIASTVPVPVVTAITLSSDKYAMSTLETANLLASVIATNGGSTAATFTVAGPGTLSGSGNGRVLTPTGPGTIDVTATSVQDPTKSATISIAVGVGISVLNVTLTGTPQSNSPLGTTNLMATVNGTGAYNAAVTWSIVGAGPGALTPGAFSSPTTSGALSFGPTPATGTTTVRATSVADPGKFADFVVTLGVDALITSIVVTPSATTVAPGGTFTASAVVSPVTRSQAVTWTVAGPAALIVTAGIPTVTTTGPGVVTITATSVANPGVSGSAIVNSIVTPVVTSVLAFRATAGGALDANPQPVPGGTSTFVSATVYGAGAISPLVTWSIVSGGGTLTPQSPNIAQYTAPAATAIGQSAVLRATSVQDPTKFGDVVIGFDTTVAATAVIWAPDGPIASTWYDDDLTPLSATVNVLGTGAYDSNVTFTGPPGVIVTPGPKNGTVTPVNITFPATNPKTPTSYTIRVTSVQDPSKFDDLIINRTYQLRPITLQLSYPGQLQVDFEATGAVPVLEVGASFLRMSAFIASAFPVAGPIPPVTWTVTGPAIFIGDIAGSVTTPTNDFDRIRLVVTGAGTVTVTATSIYDPTKSDSKTITVVATPVVTTVNVYRPDGQAPGTGIRRPAPGASPGDTAIVFTGKAIGVNIPGPFAFDGVSWSIFSGPGTLGAPFGFAGIDNDEFYAVSYLPPAGFTASSSVTLRATSFQDPSKFTDVSFQLLPNSTTNFVTSITLTEPTDLAGLPVAFNPPYSGSGQLPRNGFFSGAFEFNSRVFYHLETRTYGSGLGLSSGSNLSIVSGSQIATLNDLLNPGSAERKLTNLTRNPGQSGWVVVRATSVYDPSKYRERSFYFKPDQFSIAAVSAARDLAGSLSVNGSRFNVFRIWNVPSQPVVFNSVNCTLQGIEPSDNPATVDGSGRGVGGVIALGAQGPYSITAFPVGSPQLSQTITFAKNLVGDIVGTITPPASPNFQDFRAINENPNPSTYSISPVAPPSPPINSTI